MLVGGLLLAFALFGYGYVKEERAHHVLFQLHARTYLQRVEKAMGDTLQTAESLSLACATAERANGFHAGNAGLQFNTLAPYIVASGCVPEGPGDVMQQALSSAAVLLENQDVNAASAGAALLPTPLHDPSVERAMRSEAVTSSDVFALKEGQARNVGIRLLKRYGHGNATGVAALVVRPDGLFQSAQSALPPEQDFALAWMATTSDNAGGPKLYSTNHAALSLDAGKRWCVLACHPPRLAQTFDWAGKQWEVVVSGGGEPFMRRHEGSLKLLFAVLIVSIGAALLVRYQQGKTDRLMVLAKRRTEELKSLNRILLNDIEARKVLTDELRRSHRELRDLAEHNARVKEDERKRISREIHDELGQGLLALRMDLARLARGDTTAVARAQIDNALLQIDNTMAAMRTIINELRPAVLDLGLDVAIEWEVAKFHRRTRIECQLNLTDEVFPLDDDIATALYRIVQESLTNIMRHAQASRVDVGLWMENGWVFLTIADNGIGIADQCRRKAKSFGLIGISERVYSLGGAFDTESTAGVGTKLTIALPFAPLLELDVA